MKEEKYIASLFEAARKESPKLTFDQAADTLKSATAPATFLDVVKDFFTNLNLNSVIMMTMISCLVATLIWVMPPPTEKTETPIITDHLRSVSENHPTKEKGILETESIDTDAIVPVINPVNTKRASSKQENESASLNVLAKKLSDPETQATPITIQSENARQLPPRISTGKLALDTFPVNELERISNASRSLSDNTSVLQENPISFKRERDISIKRDIVQTRRTDWQVFTKNFSKTMPFVARDWANIKSEFGEITIKTWDKNEIEFEVIARVETSRPKKAEEVLDNLSINFQDTPTGVIAETIVNNRKGIKWHNRKNWDATIDYVVYLPASANLDLMLDHGLIVLPDLAGQVNINSRFSDLDAGNIGDNANIILHNGTGNIKNGKRVKLDLLFAKFFAEQCENVELKIKNTRLEVKEAALIEGESLWGSVHLGTVRAYENNSSGTDVFIESVETAKAKVVNTKLHIDAVKKALDLDMKFGYLSANFESQLPEMNLVTNNTDVDLILPKKATFGFDLQSNIRNYTIDWDAEITKKIERVGNYKIQGFNENANASNLLNANLTFGELTLRTK